MRADGTVCDLNVTDGGGHTAHWNKWISNMSNVHMKQLFNKSLDPTGAAWNRLVGLFVMEPGALFTSGRICSRRI